MSKIGKQPVAIPSGVTVAVAGDELLVKGDRGELHVPILSGVAVSIEGGSAHCKLLRNAKQARSNWGTVRALLQNAVSGLSKGFEKVLILEGIGFRVTKEGDSLVMSLGFSHPVRYDLPPTVTCDVEKNSILKLRGFDKALVGQVAAEIRSFRKPEPYKGTGFHYQDEVVRRKAGKKAGAATSGAAA